MAPDVELHLRMERKHDYLAGGVARERDAPRSSSLEHRVRHPGHTALDASSERLACERDTPLFPEQRVLLEEHGVALSERELGHRDHLARDLAGAVPDAEFRHVAQPRRLAP